MAALEGPRPRVTVVTPTWNRSAALRCAIRSVLDQTWTDFEYCVVGDGCSDDSAAVVGSFGDPRIRWHNLPERTGSQVAPNNAGIAMARAPYIAYLGHDDLWHPSHLATLLAAADEGADLVFTATMVYGPPGSGLRAVSGLAMPPPGERQRTPPPSSWLHRRDLIDRIGPWREQRELDVLLDREIFVRAIESGARIAVVPRLTVFKFTAAWRRDVYVNDDAAEQRQHLRRLSEEPQLVEQELLSAVAAAAEGKLIVADRPAVGSPTTVLDEAKAFKGASSELGAGVRRDRLRFELDRTLPGFEWHGVERDGSGNAFQWSGPANSATLHLPLANDRDLDLLLDLLPPLARDLLDGLRVSVNGQPLTMVRLGDRRGLVRLRARLPSAALARSVGLSRLQFDVPRTVRPVDVLPGSTDERRLGIALCAVEVTPARA